MAENLVIVESPAKARTIKKYLGKDFDVLASYGHVRDLVPKEGAVDPDTASRCNTRCSRRMSVTSRPSAGHCKQAEALYLATDPDREGEAIAWHLLEILRSRGELGSKQVHRVAFYEITRNAIREAVAQPRELSAELVNAQQARRALDYLVGFNLSPLLWKKVRRGLSAGRVQSPALRMICEREEEIAAFMAQRILDLRGRGRALRAAISPQADRVSRHEGRAIQLRYRERGARGRACGARCLGRKRQRRGPKVFAIDRKQRRRNPAPPFTTSTLQQEAARKLGFNARRTMRLAQQLYEGVDIGDGNVGLITYMRTDSVSLAAEAIQRDPGGRRQTVRRQEVAEEARIYKTKSKNAQEAHEAIRPTSAAITPGDIEGKLDPDLFKLYALIWRRAVASPDEPRHIRHGRRRHAGRADGPERHMLRANGSTLVKAGYIAVYQEGARRCQGGRRDHVAAADERRRCREAPRDPCRAAFHRTAAALLEASLVKASRSMASAGRRPTQRSSRRCRIVSTSRWTIDASCPPTSARSSTVS